ncbi:MAG: phosphoribosylaminoimidazolesuccinocarboxamide synthase, partial [Dehalococcoidia bacterium]|nr:phosphoribosylaminoimidazolesuccinocarboxamide synthase [Dehalococcoidia bacterium]
AAVIERSDILSIEAHPPLPLTRGYIAVNFMENGRRRQRSIMLPGNLLHGKQEYQKALQAMRDAGLLDQE